MATYYIATDGDDSNSGLSLAAPWLHMEKINTINLLPGDIVNIRAGTYDSYAPLFASSFYSIRINAKSGTPSAHITIQGYPPDFTGGGRVVYNCLNVSRTSGGIGICTLDCSYIDFSRISVVGPAQEVGGSSGTYAAAWWFSANTSKTSVTATNCEASFSMTGFRLDNVNSATYTNCDAHDIDDPFTGAPTGPHNNSDGFSRTNALNTATGTVYNSCRAWYCADDGWDCFGTSGTITYNNCWSFYNGYNSSLVHLGDGNGFKMGSAASTGNTRFANNNLAYGNYAHGFDQNAGNFVAVFYNNSAINNGGNDWKFGYNPPLAHVFRNNLSIGNAAIDGTSGDAADWGTNDYNSWNGGVTITTGDFVSTDASQLSDDRQADGSLPTITAYNLVIGSDLIDAGIDVGLPFNGAAPDMGAFEFGAALPEGTITGLTIAFTECDEGTVDGYQIFYRVAGDIDWIDAGLFPSSPAVITGLSYPSGTVFEVQGVNTDCDEDAPPDTIEAALELVGETWTVTGENCAATTDAFDESAWPGGTAYPLGHTVWYYWTAQQDGSVNINTAGSNFDTVLIVGQWDGVTFTEIDLNDDAVGADTALQSSLNFDAVSGETYYFGIAGYDTECGSYVFNMDLDMDTGSGASGGDRFGYAGEDDTGNEERHWTGDAAEDFTIEVGDVSTQGSQIHFFGDAGVINYTIAAEINSWVSTASNIVTIFSGYVDLSFFAQIRVEPRQITIDSGATNQVLLLKNLPTYADDAAAGAGGLVVDTVYKTLTGELRIKL